jgi:curved DNA-binding protein
MAVGYRDYYETLGVDRSASEEDIRRAYRTLARRYHPDVNKAPEAEDRFKEISEAYEVLRDPEKRERYDRLGANWRAGEDVSGASGFEGFRGGNGGGFQDVSFDFGDGDFSDFFDSVFGARGVGGARGAGGARGTGGARGARGRARPRRGSDHEATVELSLEEAARGGKRKIALADGRDYEVTIPAGVTDGQRIRLAGEGDPGAGESAAGDLYLRVRIKPHPRFRLDGRNIHVDLPVAPWEAALGAQIPVPTLTGASRVKVPPGSSSDRRLRLRGEGMPGPRGAKGDLYARVKIMVPPSPTREEREAFEHLAEVSDFNPREVR